jgi:tetratricopeptide (TPR) repeat protein
MFDITEDQLGHRRKWIPPRLDDAFWSDETYAPIAAIAPNAGLTKEQEGNLGYLMGLVLVGFLRREQLATEIASSFDLSREVAEALAKAIDDSVLAPFRCDIDRIYSPPGPVPANSPWFSDHGTDGQEHLRSAFDVITSVTDVSACNLTVEELEKELAKLRRRHGSELRLVQLAWRELARAEEYDPETVIFVSDQTYHDIPAVRAMIQSASRHLNVPVEVEEKEPTADEIRVATATKHLRTALFTLIEANEHLVKYSAAFRRGYARRTTVSNADLRASEPELRRQINQAWQEIAAAERLDKHVTLGRTEDDESEMDVPGARSFAYALNGELHMALDSTQAARESFELALRARETDHSHFMLGGICAELGQRDSALAHFRRCIELAPDGTFASAAIGAIDILQADPQRVARSGCLGGLFSALR